MKQQTLSDIEYSNRKRKTKREEFLEAMAIATTLGVTTYTVGMPLLVEELQRRGMDAGEGSLTQEQERLCFRNKNSSKSYSTFLKNAEWIFIQAAKGSICC